MLTTLQEPVLETQGSTIAAEQTGFRIYRDQPFAQVLARGKLRDRIEVPADVSEETAKELALASEKVRPHVEGKELRKAIYVPGRIVNLVVEGCGAGQMTMAAGGASGLHGGCVTGALILVG